MELSGEAVIGSLRRIIATAQNGLEVVRFGGLESGAAPSPFQVVVRTPMYRLRRYFPESDTATSGIPIVLVPPMMMSADVYDVTPGTGAVGLLHSLGLDPWVVDFGSPDQEEGGWGRTLTDHIVALDEIIDRVHEYTGRDIHLSGYSQGGMFCYQAAAYRRSRNIASLVTYGSPVDTLAALPFGIPDAVAVRSADFLADHVFNRLAISGWMARTASSSSIPSRPYAPASISSCSCTTVRHCCRVSHSAGSSIRKAGLPGRGRPSPSCCASSSPTIG